jgi:hypothetical protein
MAGTLEDLKSRIVGNEILNKESFVDVDFDAVLDERDKSLFDAEWLRVDEVVQSTKKDNRLSEKQWELIDEIRHIAFIQTGKFAGQHEMCSYVSDDFGLIATALALGYDDGWLNALWASYKDGKIPCGRLEPVKGGLSDLT